ncbi:ESX secretion-associated protein EspG [Amycolatopsis sp.]|uniref:ESX secretion-associated protein EspG n=1 Tax=Amycolatopsis sp. TaxID=37632 RepID=UPI002E00B8B4|nr:ESX secretion-associated protein EspG [Amycolatopsis sp.]
MLDKQVTISTSTLINLIRRRDGQPHTVLAETPTWYSEEALRKEAEIANDELSRFGLSGRGGLHPGLVATLEAVARPQVEYYGWIDGGYEGKALSYTLLAGSAGGEAFVLARNPDAESVVLASLKPSELLEGFITQIPKLAPGRGTPLAVPKSQVLNSGSASTARDDDGYSVMRSAKPSPDSRDAAELRRILGLRRMGGGSLYVAARGRGGGRRRIERPVNYIDTTEGRWLTEEVPGSGEPLISFAPANQQVLAERLQSAQSKLFS